MQIVTVRIDKPEAINFILGQTHFIKSVEDIHETLVASVPGIKFGLAFCEASGKALVRYDGNDTSATTCAMPRRSLIRSVCSPTFVPASIRFGFRR